MTTPSPLASNPPASIAAADDGACPGSLDRLLVWADRMRWWLFAGLIILLLGGYAPHWRVSPDSGTYLLIARSIAETGVVAHPLGLHATIAPGFPHLLAAVMRLFGSDAIWAVNALMLGLGMANAALVYWLFTLHAGRATAVVVTVLYAVTDTCYVRCFVPMADLPFATGLLLTLVGLERFEMRRPARAGSVALVAGGLVVMAVMRSVFVVAVAGIALGLAWSMIRRGRFRLLVALGVMGIVGVLTIRLLGPSRQGPLGLTSDERLMIQLVTDELPATLVRATTDNLYLLLCETASRSALGADFGPWVNLPFGLLVVASGLLLVKKRPVWGMLFAVFTLQWLLFLVTRRYFLPLMPLVAFAWWSSALWIERRFAGRFATHLGALLIVGWVSINVSRAGIFIAEQHHPRFLEIYDGGRYAGLDVMAEAIAETPGDAVVLIDGKLTAPMMVWSRHVADYRITGIAVKATRVLAVRPLAAATEADLERRSWRYGPALLTIERGEEEPAMVLHEVMRP